MRKLARDKMEVYKEYMSEVTAPYTITAKSFKIILSLTSIIMFCSFSRGQTWGQNW